MDYVRFKKLAWTVPTALLVVFMISSCGGGGGASVGVARVPLNDLGSGNYLGYVGGLYPNGANTPPTAHATLGRAKLVQPLATDGSPSSTGKIVMVSIGMSNTTQEFCSKFERFPPNPCDSWTFMGQAANDVAVNKNTLVIVNGALGSQVATQWDSFTQPNYDRILIDHLQSQGLTEEQVQVAWVKVARPNPTTSLPSSNADAYELLINLGNIMRALKQRYPNLQQVFLSSRIYGGYAPTSSLNPEPYAYETGFAVKWLIQAQIDQMQSSIVDTRAGNLNANNNTAPWLAWGPYLWADGVNPRSDGLVWNVSDFEQDYTHPALGAETKVANQLLSFFKNSEFTRCWFTNSGTCP